MSFSWPRFQLPRFMVLASLSVLLLIRPALPPLASAASAKGNQTVSNTPAVHVQLVASNLNKLVAMVFDSTGRIFFTEKTGRVRLIVHDQLVSTPVMEFDVDWCSERGLLGITLDPGFTTNHYVYVYYTANPGSLCGHTENRVVRFTEVNGVGQNPVTLFTSPAVGPGNHNGGNLHFGPDGKLYVTIGNDNIDSTSQDLGQKNGKMHRLNPDGTIPTDNPFYGQPGVEGSIYAYGLRNSFDFDFDPVTRVLFASENGPTCDDEVNRLLPGYDYGWRVDYPCGDNDRTYNTIAPLWRWTPTIAPTGITFYRGSLVPAFHNQLFMCAYEDFNLHLLQLNVNRTRIVRDRIVPLPEGVGCREEVETGTVDGALYFVDGGGYNPATLYRIVP